MIFKLKLNTENYRAFRVIITFARHDGHSIESRFVFICVGINIDIVKAIVIPPSKVIRTTVLVVDCDKIVDLSFNIFRNLIEC